MLVRIASQVNKRAADLHCSRCRPAGLLLLRLLPLHLLPEQAGSCWGSSANRCVKVGKIHNVVFACRLSCCGGCFRRARCA